MIWWWIFIVVMILMVIVMLAVAALLARGEDAPILRGVIISIAVYAMPLLIEWTLLRRDLNPWLVCVFLADLPGALLLYRLGYRKTAMLTYAAATLVEATLLSNGITPRQVMIVNNVAPAIAVGSAIAWRPRAHRVARI